MVCRPKHVEQLRNIGIINSTTRLHLVGSFYEIYITMHGSMNIMVVTVGHGKRQKQVFPSAVEWPRCLKAWVRVRSLAGIAGSNPRRWHECLSVSCECCVLSGRGLCDVPIACPEEYY